MHVSNKMTTEEHYSLRWNNHQTHILKAFDSLLQTKTLVDVTLVCAETSIRAHKVVLSACSPFFQRVFSETPCKHPVIVLKDFRGWVIQAIVDFMYRGEISVPQEKLQTLVQAGDSLQVRGLVDHPASGVTPTPASSLDDFIPEEDLVPPPSPSQHDSFMDKSSSNRRHQHYHHRHQSLVSTNSSKIFLSSPHHAYLERQSHKTDNSDRCISPMPRRKQARPRRRSGECAPHDLSAGSKPSTPTLHMQTDNSSGAEDGDDERIEDDVDNKISSIKRPLSCMSDDIDNEDYDNCDDMTDFENRGIPTMQAQSEEDKYSVPENLCTKNPASNNNNSENLINNNKSNNNNRIVLSLKDIRHLNRPSSMCTSLPQSSNQPIPASSQSSQSHQSIPLTNSSTPPLPPHIPPSQFPIHLSEHNLSNNNVTNSKDDSSNLSFMHQSENVKRETPEGQVDSDNTLSDEIDLTIQSSKNLPNIMLPERQLISHHKQQSITHQMHHPGNAMQRNSRSNEFDCKDFPPNSPLSLPPHFNPREITTHPPSPLPFPGMSSSLTLTPPHHLFGLDSPLGLFPPGMDPGKLYNPLMEMSDPRGIHLDHPPPFLKKKMSRPKGQHSAPRGGPPRSWTNAELTEALQHVWNKKMTTSQASRIFGIPYNSLLMYVRGKYGKSLKLEQLRKDCISGPPIELLTMGLNSHNNNNKNLGDHRHKELRDLENLPIPRSASSEPDLLSSANAMFNPFPPGFYTDFPGGFPGLPLSMLNLLPPDRHHSSGQSILHGTMSVVDEDCKSDRSKQSLEEELPMQLALTHDQRRDLLQQNGQD